MTQTKPTIAYIEQKLPGLTTTFIYREIFELQKRGFKVITFSVHRPQPADLSAEALSLLETTHYIDGTPWHLLAKAHLYYIFKSPFRYLSVFLFLSSRQYETFSDRKRTILHFLGGIYFAHLAQTHDVKHIHAHFAVLSTTISMVVSRMLRIPYSFTAHSACFAERIILPDKIEGAKFIASISNYTSAFLIDQSRDPASARDKIHIVHCGIPVTDFTPPGHRVSVDPPTILSVAYLIECKGMGYLIDACHLLKERGIPFRCVIVGDGPLYNQLNQQISDRNLQEEVSMPGRIFQEDLKQYLHQADIFAMACNHEKSGIVDGIPVVFMEAMATEIPCVSTTVSGIPDLIEHGVTGLLVDQKNAPAFADALQCLILNKDLRRAMGTASRKKIIEEFNIETTAGQMAELIECHLEPEHRT